MLLISLIGMFVAFILTVYGNALRHPEMDRYFCKRQPQSRKEEEELRRSNGRKGRYILIIGIGSFFLFLTLTILYVNAF